MGNSKEKIRRGPDIHDHILEVAGRLFYEHGVNSVGIELIIAEADVAKRTFYNHFESKEDLVVEYLEQTEIRALQYYKDRLAKLPPGERLLGFFDLLEDWFGSREFRGCNFINATAEAGRKYQRQISVSARYKQEVANLLAQLARDAGFKNSARLGEQLTYLADGATIRAQMDGSPKHATIAKHAARIIIQRALKSVKRSS
jgi:AcrR family transcriptional regulator